jgi:hypothetical protein
LIARIFCWPSSSWRRRERERERESAGIGARKHPAAMAGGGVAALGVKTERAAQYKGRMTLAVATTCLVAAVGGAIFGYDIGISGTYVRAPLPHPCRVRLILSPVSERANEQAG